MRFAVGGLAQHLQQPVILAVAARRLPFWQFPYRGGGGDLYTTPMGDTTPNPPLDFDLSYNRTPTVSTPLYGV